MKVRLLSTCSLSAVTAAAILGLAGCGAPTHGNVSGKVTYRGKSVPHGQVSFLPRSGVPVCADIASDGSYVVRNVPFGEAIVTVSSRPAGYVDLATRGQSARDQALARGKLPQDVFAAPANHSATVLPKEFASSQSSKLRCNVDRRENTFDITLK